MKLIIAGGRDYEFSGEDMDKLDSLNASNKVTAVISGGAKGADREGEMWAHCRGIQVIVFKADWDKHGKAAGPIRNRQMAEYADAVFLFPGGRGTVSMRQEAEKAGILIYN